MRASRFRGLLGPGLLATLLVGCNTAPPGDGFTNGPPPTYSPEKPAVRTDEPPPDIPDKDVLAGEKPAAKPASDANAPTAGGAEHK